MTRQRLVDLCVSYMLCTAVVRAMMGVGSDHDFRHILTCSDCQKQMLESVRRLWPVMCEHFNILPQNVVKLRR